ncbi:MAG: hypothetical protein M3Q56_08240 [Bacteroidota bacterium]|nr:hypothetical protein [Bacteroidota bacterium]
MKRKLLFALGVIMILLYFVKEAAFKVDAFTSRKYENSKHKMEELKSTVHQLKEEFKLKQKETLDSFQILISEFKTELKKEAQE